ncbi:MAG: DUF2905 domain-containing protein [Deltaproteobacteria bacterium]|nr:DUF2905 domain-containing protein [Deltaproteobacteria bacterium]
MAKALFWAGIALAAAGLILMGLSRLPFLGRLPLDLHVQRGRKELFIPLGTALVLSLAATLILNLVLLLLPASAGP